MAAMTLAISVLGPHQSMAQQADAYFSRLEKIVKQEDTLTVILNRNGLGARLALKF